VRILSILMLSGLLAAMPVPARAFHNDEALRQLQAQFDTGGAGDSRIAQQGGGVSLSEAIEQVRQQTDGRILSAETRVNGNREVHHIKVLTKDGKVKTFKIQGRRLDR
jgi:uncharacterized membrane protein YkoI